MNHRRARPRPVTRHTAFPWVSASLRRQRPGAATARESPATRPISRDRRSASARYCAPSPANRLRTGGGARHARSGPGQGPPQSACPAVARAAPRSAARACSAPVAAGRPHPLPRVARARYRRKERTGRIPVSGAGRRFRASPKSATTSPPTPRRSRTRTDCRTATTTSGSESTAAPGRTEGDGAGARSRCWTERESRYGPAEPLIDIGDHLARGRRFAFIGKPCDIAACHLSSHASRPPEGLGHLAGRVRPVQPDVGEQVVVEVEQMAPGAGSPVPGPQRGQRLSDEVGSMRLDASVERGIRVPVPRARRLRGSVRPRPA